MNNVIKIGKSGREEIQTKIFPEKLQKARKALLLTQTELAARVGLTRQAISSYEQGTKQPDTANLIKIASELQQPISYFVARPHESFGVFSARNYRAFGASTKKRNEQCDVLSEWVTTIASFLSGTINFPEPSIPEISPPEDGSNYSDEEIEQAAELVRDSWGLGSGPIGNLTKLIESKGIFVSHLPFVDKGVNAFSFWSGTKPFIVAGGEETTAVRRRFDMAHELGHLVLHQGIDESELEDKEVLSRVEAEANRFAGAFLLPRISYPNEVFSTRLDAFLELKTRWKVAVSAQVYRCSDLGLFTERQILNLRKQISFKKWRKREPLDASMTIEEPGMLQRASRIALDAGVLSPDAMFNALNFNKKIISQVSGISIEEFGNTVIAADPYLSIK